MIYLGRSDTGDSPLGAARICVLVDGQPIGDIVSVQINKSSTTTNAYQFTNQKVGNLLRGHAKVGWQTRRTASGMEVVLLMQVCFEKRMARYGVVHVC